MLEPTTLLLALAAVAPAAPAVAAAAAGRPWMANPAAPPRDRAMQLLAAMDFDEKVALLHGSRLSRSVAKNSKQSKRHCCTLFNTCTEIDMGLLSRAKECGECPYGDPRKPKQYNQCYTGNSGIECHTGVPSRHGIPVLRANDGPQGFRSDGKGQPDKISTAWPAAITVAASWDPIIARRWGTLMGKEFYNLGANVQLGPGLCVARVPTGGRNFEYLSGEDPHLGSILSGPAVQGIQSQGVIANAKHYIDNNQETERFDITAVVDERTNFEVYYRPFKAAVDGKTYLVDVLAPCLIDGATMRLTTLLMDSGHL